MISKELHKVSLDVGFCLLNSCKLLRWQKLHSVLGHVFLLTLDEHIHLCLQELGWLSCIFTHHCRWSSKLSCRLVIVCSIVMSTSQGRCILYRRLQICVVISSANCSGSFWIQGACYWSRCWNSWRWIRKSTTNETLALRHVHLCVVADCSSALRRLVDNELLGLISLINLLLKVSKFFLEDLKNGFLLLLESWLYFITHVLTIYSVSLLKVFDIMHTRAYIDFLVGTIISVELIHNLREVSLLVNVILEPIKRSVSRVSEVIAKEAHKIVVQVEGLKHSLIYKDSFLINISFEPNMIIRRFIVRVVWVCKIIFSAGKVRNRLLDISLIVELVVFVHQDIVQNDSSYLLVIFFKLWLGSMWLLFQRFVCLELFFALELLMQA